MKYAVTAASSHYGSHALQTLLDLGTNPADIVALLRDTTKAADLAAQGVEVRELDYNGDLTGRFDGIDRVLFIPTADHSGRVEMHRRLIDAIEEAGVQTLLYVSFINATEFPEGPLTPDHAATEKMLDESGMQTLSVRSGFYFQNVLSGAEGYLATGTMPSLSGDGRIAGASRDEMAEAAARLLVSDTVPTGVLTLAAPEITKADMAQGLSEATGQEVKVADVTPEQYQQGLQQAGMPEPVAASYTAVDAVGAQGAYASSSDDLERILGRAPKTFAQVAKEWAQQR